MYQTSHCGYATNSGLERIASSYNSFASDRTCYSISSEPSFSYQEPISISNLAVRYSSEEIPKTYSNDKTTYQLFKTKPEYSFSPETFLKPGKEGVFVGKAEEIREDIENTFEKIFGSPFPNDIKVSILDEKEFKKITPSQGVIGLSINRGQYGLLSEIFVLNDTVGRVMLTIGHELGHVLTPTLKSAHDEEAKAYAFSLIWMRTIKENNICGLKEALIIENPALNGLHNVSFYFVHQQIDYGKDEWEIYREIIGNKVGVGVF
ncbi:MAG: hypothetical protein KKA62_01715 [Nanoarchaeota archaeon]|nr:hypothetical protein [Nanoarchaeota archaeon]MBU1976650.1 hypothetical protein [Nanoarchaeota archaeon]